MWRTFLTHHGRVARQAMLTQGKTVLWGFTTVKQSYVVGPAASLFSTTSGLSLSPPGGGGDRSRSEYGGVDNIALGVGGGGSGEEDRGVDKDNITFAEAKKLMRLVNVESLKIQLGMEGKEVIGYSDLLKACESMGVARSLDEAKAFAHVLDEAGVVLLFRDKVYLHPDKVVDLVRKAVPIALMPDDDPTRDELRILNDRKGEIDVLAHKQVRRILWTGLGLAMMQVGLFFRLTFWEFSWDVMEPISFFVTTSGIVIGYAYFLFTSRDPTYQDFMKRLFLSRQRKLFKKLKFDVDRFKELQTKCKTPLHATASIKKRIGVDIDLEDALHHHKD